MASAAEKGLGAVLEYFPSHAPIAEIIDFPEFGMTRSDVDVTSHDSSGNAEEFIAGLKNMGELTMVGNLISGDTSGQIQLITDCAAGTIKRFMIRLPNTTASTYEFFAYVKSYKIKAELKGQQKITLVLKVAKGTPAWTA